MAQDTKVSQIKIRFNVWLCIAGSTLWVSPINILTTQLSKYLALTPMAQGFSVR